MRPSRTEHVASPPGLPPFVVRDCALVAIATGHRAHNLRELADRLPADCLDFHFWGRLLRPTFDDPQYNNDFASWVRHSLHDKRLAEQLAVIDPGDFASLEDLRHEVTITIEARLDESEGLRWTHADSPFHFVQSHTVVFDTGRRARDPHELGALMPALSLGSVYYHCIDARQRTPGRQDDFRGWVEQAHDGYHRLAARLAAVDPYFTSLAGLRAQLAAVFAEELREPVPA
jgi:hypothetical protein